MLNFNRRFRCLVFGHCILFGICVLCIGISGVLASNIDTVKTYFINGDYRGCIREGENILASSKVRKKNRDEVRYFLALSYLKEGNPLPASRNFKIILNEFRKSKFREESQIGLGDSYFMRGDYTIADFQYKELLNKNPKTKLKPGLYYRLGQIGLKKGNKQQQEEYLARLKKEFPLSPEALMRMDRELFPLNIQIQTGQGPIIPETNASYSVQVGAFSRKTNAENLAKRLRNKGYVSLISESLYRDNKIYKVRVGSFKNRSEAEGLEQKLKTEGYSTKIIP